MAKRAYLLAEELKISPSKVVEVMSTLVIGKNVLGLLTEREQDAIKKYLLSGELDYKLLNMNREKAEAMAAEKKREEEEEVRRETEKVIAVAAKFAIKSAIKSFLGGQ